MKAEEYLKEYEALKPRYPFAKKELVFAELYAREDMPLEKIMKENNEKTKKLYVKNLSKFLAIISIAYLFTLLTIAIMHKIHNKNILLNILEKYKIEAIFIRHNLNSMSNFEIIDYIKRMLGREDIEGVFINTKAIKTGYGNYIETDLNSEIAEWFIIKKPYLYIPFNRGYINLTLKIDVKKSSYLLKAYTFLTVLYISLILIISKNIKTIFILFFAGFLISDFKKIILQLESDGRVYKKNGEILNAVLKFEEVLELEPSRENSFKHIKDIYTQLYTERNLGVYDEKTRLYMDGVLSYIEGDLAAATHTLTKYIEFDRENKEVIEFLRDVKNGIIFDSGAYEFYKNGVELYRSGVYEDAYKNFSIALVLKPSCIPAYFFKENTLKKTKEVYIKKIDEEKSEAFYKKAVEAYSSGNKRLARRFLIEAYRYNPILKIRKEIEKTYE